MAENLRVIVLSRSELRRSGLSAALSEYPDVAVAGEATDIDTAIKLLKQTGVENVMIDLAAIADEDVPTLRSLGADADGSISIVAFGQADDAVMKAAMDIAPILD